MTNLSLLLEPSILSEVFLQGLVRGSMYALMGAGLSLIFGILGVANFAHGALFMMGAYVMVSVGVMLGLPFVVGIAAAAAVLFLAGMIIERGLIATLRKRAGRDWLLDSFVLTIGLSLLGRHLLLLFFGGNPERYTDYTLQSEWNIGFLSITPRDLTIMLLSIAVLIGVALVLQRTRIGKAMRAVSDNIDLAESSGIDVNRVTLVVWIAGAALAGLGGIFLGSVEAVDWLMGFRLLLMMFAAVVLGGLGTAYGAMAGGLVIGVVTEVSTIWFQPEIKSVFALGVLILVLLVRPQGILGLKERIG